MASAGEIDDEAIEELLEEDPTESKEMYKKKIAALLKVAAQRINESDLADSGDYRNAVNMSPSNYHMSAHFGG